MIEIKTKFGILYVENFDDSREESERIKVFDSLERYFDYIDVESLYNRADAYQHTVHEELTSIFEEWKKCNSINELMRSVGVKYELITENWEEAALCVDEHTSEEELLGNEWINKIGNYYIVISEN